MSPKNRAPDGLNVQVKSPSIPVIVLAFRYTPWWMCTMMWGRRRACAVDVTLSGTVLVALATSMMAFGVLVVPGGRRSAELYPCSGGNCGCVSAEQCWRHCCCMSLEQRIAWAKSHRVPVPDYVDEQSVCRESGGLGSRSCCSGRKKGGSQTEYVTEPTSHHPDHVLNSEKPADCPFVFISSVLRCRGLASWLAFVALALQAANDWGFDADCSSSPLCIAARIYQTITLGPDPPPPRGTIS